MADGIRVKGYREFVRAIDRASKETKKAVRDELRQAGEVVRRDASQRFAPVSPRSAAGYRVVVRQRGVAVEQRLRKTTGQHPQWGALQMRKALVPAVRDNEAEIEAAFGQAIDRIVNRLAH